MEILQAFFDLPADQKMRILLVNYAWIPVALTFLYGAKELWVFYINTKWGDIHDQMIFLAIDIPKGNEQSPKAVENLVTYLAGAHGTYNLIELYWEGRYQLIFSLEIVSIDGYTQFIVKTPPHFRNLVESAVYSQYPDAEITEVNDYTEGMPSKFPDDEWDMWGGEFIFAKNEAYPIKTWPEFENEIAGRAETQYKDPMASLMDLCSSLQKGEQLWYQLLVKPIGFDWMDDLNKEVGKILREKPAGKKPGAVGTFLAEIKSLIDEFTRQIADMILGGGAAAEEKADDSLKMMNLKPQEKKKVEGIQRKISKLGFKCKNRFIYIAKKDVINKPKVVNGFVGYMKQFMDLDLNNLKPDMDVTVTTASYFFKQQRIDAKKTRLINAYKGRSTTRGRMTQLFNIEEIATLWHFPIEANVRAPMIQKTPGRKAEAPMTLPVAEEAVGTDKIFEPVGDGEDIFLEEDEQFSGAPTSPWLRGASRGQESGDNKDEGATEEDIFTLEDEDEQVPGDEAGKDGDLALSANSQNRLEPDNKNAENERMPGVVAEAREQSAQTKKTTRPSKHGSPPQNLPIA